MVLFDGFGFGFETRLPEYQVVMQRLNTYARERGIHLVFGGYGAGYGIAYQPGPLYENAPLHNAPRLNREYYPDGPTYKCMGYPRTRQGREPGIYGMCRSNEELNKLKAEELSAFVKAVEPGALYIHHEDFGGMDTTQQYWLERCESCRERWPNDEAAAADGAAGAIGHAYTVLVDAVNSVSNKESGYKADRDCIVILTSPVYMPSAPSSEGWGNALRLWQNAGRALPPAENLMTCFREVFPRDQGRIRWADAFNSAMEEAGVSLGLWMYFVGGADHWMNDYPFVGTPALNILFHGAQGIFNGCGDAYQEPQQLLNAEYSWNVHSDDPLIEPAMYEEENVEEVWRRLANTDLRPPVLFGPGGFLEQACRHLYGNVSTPLMVRHFSEYAELAPSETDETVSQVSDGQAQLAAVERRKHGYLPMVYDKIYGIPALWRRLALDTKTWTEAISNEVYAKRFETCNISRAELHARLKRQWTLTHEQSEHSLALITEALASDPKPSAQPDLEFLQQNLRVTIPLSQALSKFHKAKELHHAENSKQEETEGHLEQARKYSGEAGGLARTFFPDVSDPAGAEVGSLQITIKELQTAIDRMLEEA